MIYKNIRYIKLADHPTSMDLWRRTNRQGTNGHYTVTPNTTRETIKKTWNTHAGYPTFECKPATRGDTIILVF